MSAGFSVTDAALEGFRITRERPSMLLAWALLAFLFSMISGVVVFAIAGPAAMRLAAPEANADPAQMVQLMYQILPAYAVVLLIGLLYYPLLLAAGNRAVLRPQERGFGYIRFGKAELMQLGALLALAVVYVLAYAILFGAVFALGVAAQAASRIVGVAVMIVLMIAAYAAVIWVAVRLSFTSAATFDTGRIGLLESWRLTSGRFWPLFGAYLLAFFLMLVLGLLALVVIGVIGVLVNGGVAAVSRQPVVVGGMALVLSLVQLALWMFILALWHAVTICTPAYAYRQITRAGAGVATAEAFD